MAGGIQAAVIFSSVKKHPIMIYFLGGFCLFSLMPPIYKILLFFSPLLLSTAVCTVALMFLGPSTSQYTAPFNGGTTLSNKSSTDNINREQQQSLAAVQEDDALASLVNLEPHAVDTDPSRHRGPLINMAAAAAAAGSNNVGNSAAVDDQYKINESYTRKCSGHGPVEVKGGYNINSGPSTRIESDQGPCTDDTRPDRAAEADHQAAARPADCDDIQSSTEPDPDLAMEESPSPAPAPHAMESKATMLTTSAKQYSGDRAALYASLAYTHNIKTSSSFNPISQMLHAAA